MGKEKDLEICECGHHKNFHLNEFTGEKGCVYGMRIGEEGIINEGCKCKMFLEDKTEPVKACRR